MLFCLFLQSELSCPQFKIMGYKILFASLILTSNQKKKLKQIHKKIKRKILKYTTREKSPSQKKTGRMRRLQNNLQTNNKIAGVILIYH